MSLVGNLEDLSLGDIMQIISLSQKSGVLALEGEAGIGQIVFLNGLVHAASVKGRADDLRGVLVEKGLLEGPLFDRLEARARELGLPIDEMVTRQGALSAEQIDDALREATEAAILSMFSWPSGDFSFDVRSELAPEDPQLLLASGINAQYLAMEGMRISDERSRDGAEPSADPSEDSASADSVHSVEGLFGDEPLETEEFIPANETDETHEAEVVALDVDDDLSAADFLVATVVAREDEDVGPERMDAVVAEREPAIAAQLAIESPPKKALSTSAALSTSVVVIDSDVSVLEWVKSTIQDDFARVHVFQQAEQGLARIRQYLIRGELPLVLISTEIQIDPLSGIHGLSDFVARLKTQASRLVIVGLHEDHDETPPSTTIRFDGVLRRPVGKQLRESGESVASKSSQALCAGLQEILVGRTNSASASETQPATTSSESLRDLRDTTRRLQQASSRGEILPVVLEFASEIFARVAILIVRADQVFAIAGRRIDALEVKDPLDSAPPVSLQTLDAGWIRQVLETGKAVQGPPATAADRDLLARMGGVEPTEAYLGPIETGRSTIALLYGDQAPDGADLPDTSGLEVVLQHAGLALDRAALERALPEADANER